ncbi:MAG: beta-ketoacyl-ACP synthase III [Flavobacteriales bacterium]|nr:beta-ketoacyl-ACP synthase III [Flavobacteriales bacterium]
MSGVYITALSKFLPHGPVSNEEMESYLGMIGGNPSRSRAIVLRNNGIQQRYYAIDRERNLHYSNAQMAVNAIKGLDSEEFRIRNVDIIACGTSAPDQTLPSHTAMVHGLLDFPAELMSPSGACCSGIHAMKYGFLSLLAGESDSAITAGSELISPMMMAHLFESGDEQAKLEALKQNPAIGFEKDFLRWMLSDGAGAALLRREPNRNGISLKIEWIDGRSYAHRMDTCMYSSSGKTEDGQLKSWKQFTPQQWVDQAVFSMKQDVKLLSMNIVPIGGEFLQEICEKRGFDIGTVDWFLPHLSSNFFKEKVFDELKGRGMEIPEEKWFTNLTNVGNVGSASIYLILEELFHSGRLKVGQKLLLMVPESARFSYSYALMTVC